MCLAIPAKIVSIEESGMALAEIEGVTRRVSLQLLEEPKVGDWVIIHAGYAIDRIDEEEAKETLNMLEGLGGIS